MSILDLDTPPWQVITQYLDPYACVNVANAHPILRRHIRKVAQMILRRHYPYMYNATDPFPRLLHAGIHSRYKVRLRIPPSKNLLECTELVYVGMENHVTRGDRHIDVNETEWFTDFTVPGSRLPPIQTYLLIYMPTFYSYTRICCFLSVDHAIDYYIDTQWRVNLQTLHHNFARNWQGDSKLYEVEFQCWLKDNTPIHPYTPENIRAWLRKHMCVWLIDATIARDYVQILPIMMQ